ncbi:MAG: hypothetical protein M1830_006926 [Pleopsidium flavum]|nr:MAG: hypothetical protein M1830_006926 [Pleopsidium flavum]
MDPNLLQRQQQYHNGRSYHQPSEDGSRPQDDQGIVQNPARNPRYSYMDTPTEYQTPVFPSFSRPSEPTIPQSPASEAQPISQQDPPYSPYPVEKATVGRAASPYGLPPPQEPHPAQFAPYADSPFQSILPKASSNLNAPSSQSPIPVKDELAPPEPGLTIPHGTSHGSAPSAAHASMPSATPATTQEPQWSSPPFNQIPTYNPASMSGPNGVTPASHQPGQSVHPNMEINDGQWKNDLCGCEASICALGLCCPCILYGKTEYRLAQRAAKKDPTDLLGYSACNGPCGLMAIACGFQWVLAAIQHTRIRKAFSLQGTIASDCITSICCCCCVLMQNEREVRDREELLRRHAGPAAGAGTAAYVAPGTMTYAPPPR